ncbi:aminotransferase class V-fold PLP-dependent enzyme [Rapidithrix thailandica]|uniref:Aminotransferase class V-fold PLP-dependent enzyme n=1 Tax=Rapidithrix thailandica TaxID=413964 RepID=A0AAW9RTN4_9BACT
MNTKVTLDFTARERKNIWEFLITRLEEYYENTSRQKVAPALEMQAIRKLVEQHDFQKPLVAREALEHVLKGLSEFTVHTSHPSYFGLFNPRSNFPGILADVITAVFNPQMAAWSHAPFAAEVENYCIKGLGKMFGYEESYIDGTFCTGGAEANLTAVLCALNHHFPQYANEGLRGLEVSPVLYCSAEAHHSVIRAAKVVGLGWDALRPIPVDAMGKMQPDCLEAQLLTDRKNGSEPFMLIANAGSTGTGALDPLQELAQTAKKYGLWYHVDAAYGGALIVEPELKKYLEGIEESDSITIDIHKWFSAPMATSMFITRHPASLHQTFRITADYMPKEASEMKVTDPYTHSLQWSRRFIGLKFYLQLLMVGWEGLAGMVRSVSETGALLKKQLLEHDWELLNDTCLPIVCFTDARFTTDSQFVPALCQEVVNSGKAWISIYTIKKMPALRACITNYTSTEKEVGDLVNLLNKLRKKYLKG